MTSGTSTGKWMVFPGMAVGVVLVLIGLHLKNAEAQQVLPPSGTHHAQTVIVAPTRTPSPTHTPTSTPQVKFTPINDTRCGCPPGKTCLTFDDSFYGGQTGKIIDFAAYAKSLGVGLYFFQLSQQADAYEAQTGVNVYDSVRSLGMYTGNHTYDHKILTDVTLTKAEWEITRGAKSGWLRPPGGASNLAVRRLAYKHQQDVCTWTFDTLDWQADAKGHLQTGQQICSKVVAGAPKGAVVLMHLNHNAARNKWLKCIVDGLQAKGHSLCRPYTATHPGEATPVRLYKLPC